MEFNIGLPSLESSEAKSIRVSSHRAQRSGLKSRFFLAQLKKSKQIFGWVRILFKIWWKRDGEKLEEMGLRSEPQYLGCLWKRIADACKANWVSLIWDLQLGVGFSRALLRCLFLSIFEEMQKKQINFFFKNRGEQRDT